MLSKYKSTFLSVLVFMAMLLPGVNSFDSYAQPLKEDIEINAVEAPSIIVMQDTISEEDSREAGENQHYSERFKIAFLLRTISNHLF